MANPITLTLPLPTAILRFPRRYPLTLLVLVLPFSLLLYTYFDPVRRGKVAFMKEYEGSTLHHNGGDMATSPNHAQEGQQSPILLVSSFFPPSSSASNYKLPPHIQTTLQSLQTPLYIYTSPSLLPTLSQALTLVTVTFNTTFLSPLDIPPFQSRGVKERYEEVNREMNVKSGRSAGLAGLGTPEEYAGRNAKVWFLDEAVRVRSSSSSVPLEYAFYVDISSFPSFPSLSSSSPSSSSPSKALQSWPSIGRLRQLWETGSRESGTKPDKLVFFPMRDLPHISMLLWKEDMGPIENEFMQTTFFGGPPPSISLLSRRFYAYHDYYLSAGAFMGNDRALVNSLAHLFPGEVMTVWPGDPRGVLPVVVNPKSSTTKNSPRSSLTSTYRYSNPSETSLVTLSGLLGDCGGAHSERSYYLFWLADEEERDEIREGWMRGWRWGRVWDWSWWDWVSGSSYGRGRGRGRCGETLPLSVEWLLKRPYGESWYPPERVIRVPNGT